MNLGIIQLVVSGRLTLHDDLLLVIGWFRDNGGVSNSDFWVPVDLLWYRIYALDMRNLNIIRLNINFWSWGHERALYKVSLLFALISSANFTLISNINFALVSALVPKLNIDVLSTLVAD